MADKLTPQQARAVTDRGGVLLVSAAAGSGKTKVLVDRLLGYLTDETDPANLDEFLIITYTKAAASELRGKIAAKLTERISQAPENRHLQKQMQRLFLTKISTVHGFCSDLLREYAYKLDMPGDFRVADESECREIRERVLTDLLDRAYTDAYADADFLSFVDTQGLGRDDRLVPQIIEKVYDSARCHLDPEGWLEGCLAASAVEGKQDAAQTVWGTYLVESLVSYLDSQIHVLSQCVKGAEQYPEMEKAATNLKDTLYQLQHLRDSETWDQIVARKNIDYGRLNFPRKNNPDPELTEQIKAVRSACRKGLERKLQSFSDVSSQVIADQQKVASAERGLAALVRQFEQDYAAAKRSRHCLDFSDLEHKTLDLLLGKSRSHPTVAAMEIGKRYREVMVDEYQDSNGVQDAIFTALTRQRGNCFLVGDVKQSIYQFRLADPNIFLEKYDAYVPAEEATSGQGRKVLLSHNFRSGGEVIEAVNDVFSACMTPQVGGLYYTDAEALREGIPHEPLAEPGVELFAIPVQENTYEEEANFVADKIWQMLDGGTKIRKDGLWKPVQPEDIVILLRSPGSAGNEFRKALEARGIRCTTGGGNNLLKTEEIGTLRAFLQTICNPRQDIPLISTLASPIFGFTADELAELRSANKKGSIYEALLASGEPKVQQFLKTLQFLRKEARMNTLTVLLEKCFALTRLDSIYGAMSAGEVRSANIQLFYQLAVDFEKGNLRDLPQFLEYLDAIEERGLMTSGAAAGGCVQIMSIHKSKGLEFPVVFLCNLSRKFNMEDLRGQILCDKELGLGLSVVDHGSRFRYPSVAKRAIAAKMAAQSVSEEMRVLYVAMTRARDRLTMTYASRNLEADLRDIALRMDFDKGQLLCQDAICMGDWVLLAAMERTEAGELHALGGRPRETRLSAFPWNIRVAEAPDAVLETIQQDTGGQSTDLPLEELKKALAFRYRHLAATEAPSKQTATQRKGRLKDAEAAENSPDKERGVRSCRVPTFRSQAPTGKSVGDAMHKVMQYIRYENCVDRQGVEQELLRLTEEGFLSQEQGSLVPCDRIAAFFATPIGTSLRTGTPHIREFKFSLLDDGSHYGDGLEGEKVLLQGVVDCALLEEDGVTVLDFKSDHVTDVTVGERAESYRGQVEAYAQALSRIFERPVKAKFLYFFQLNRFVEL